MRRCEVRTTIHVIISGKEHEDYASELSSDGSEFSGKKAERALRSILREQRTIAIPE